MYRIGKFQVGSSWKHGVVPGTDLDRWDLNTKLLSPVYLGLIALPHLESLYVRLPSTRSPCPTIVIPAMPGLRSLTVTHVDPLCYPDDISTLLFESKKIDTLKLHWSPRMRDAGEPSVHLQTYFHKIIAAKQPLKIKTLGIYNLFALPLKEAMDESFIENVTILNCFGSDDTRHTSAGSVGPLTFIDDSWRRAPKNIVRLKSFRNDRLSRAHCTLLGSTTGLERIYLVNKRHEPTAQKGDYCHSSPSLTESTTLSDHSTAATPNTSLRDAYLEAIISNHGRTLRHLLLPDQWPLPASLFARLFRACPNLTQLAMAMEFASFERIRLLLPFLKKIHMIRLLIPTTGRDAQDTVFQNVVACDDETHEANISRETATDDFPSLRYIGLGWKLWEIGENYETQVVDEDGNEVTVVRRRTKRVDIETVKDAAIWTLDSLDVV